MAKIEKFDDLFVWQEGLAQAVKLYKLLGNCTDYGLRDQMRRCSVSVPSNIAEGYERQTNREFIRYLRIAKGSNGELRTQIHLAIAIDVIDADTGQGLLDKSRLISAMLQNLLKVRIEKFDQDQEQKRTNRKQK
ncbi:four helix bundle protein [Fibrella sp. HMF5335]|uniref:Four helix bundle protein n=1 Tax=Fibrella rubiginis TaxID=2817060 RepID=A0A939GGN0_9BACT|nr:four helix bundle protein [Fibrella rubiginis]MBO0937438.1 four helix bundle protein [Fibrella rubiginis]